MHKYPVAYNVHVRPERATRNVHRVLLWLRDVMQSQSEEFRVEPTAFQQLNGPEDPQSLSTASSYGAEAMTPGNGECDLRHPAGVLERAKTYSYNNWQHLERLLLAVVIVVVLMLLLLPTIFYHLPLPPVIRYT